MATDVHVAGHPTAQRRATWTQGIRRGITKYGLLYLMLLPGVFYFIVFKYAPMYGAIIAFKNYRVLDGIIGSPWTGLDNFNTVFASPYFVNVLTNTLLISTYKIIVGIPASIAMALVLDEVRLHWLKRSVQTIIYLPHFLSWVIVFGILTAVLSAPDGLLNQGIAALGGTPTTFLSDSHWFRSVVVLSSVWKDVGWGAIIYLAALAGVSPHLYEAASVDGASRFRRIWHISLPSLVPVIALVTLLSIGNILSAGFDQVFVLYNPSVYNVGDIIDTWVYRQGIEGFQFSVAAAVGLFKGAVGFVLIVVANRVAKSLTGNGIW
jgi:putative aldouronate transport system permease protein